MPIIPLKSIFPFKQIEPAENGKCNSNPTLTSLNQKCFNGINMLGFPVECYNFEKVKRI